MWSRAKKTRDIETLTFLVGVDGHTVSAIISRQRHLHEVTKIVPLEILNELTNQPVQFNSIGKTFSVCNYSVGNVVNGGTSEKLRCAALCSATRACVSFHLDSDGKCVLEETINNSNGYNEI